MLVRKWTVGLFAHLFSLLLTEMRRKQPAPPPPVLNCVRLITYALVDKAVGFPGRTLLFRDGEEIGRVPRLAIGKDIHAELRSVYPAVRRVAALASDQHKAGHLDFAGMSYEHRKIWCMGDVSY